MAERRTDHFNLGLFGTSVKGGLTITTAEGTYDTEWDLTERLVKKADRLGFEYVIPVARWKGFGGPSDFHGASYETFTWAAGLAAVTEQTMIVSTCHVPIYHPLLAAKLSATVDHIAHGRFGLNIVAGWNEPELAMFGAPMRDHDERYKVASEWIEALRRAWTEDEEFDFDGVYYSMHNVSSRPHPIQKPYPKILFAGGSDTGRRFAAKNADIAFVAWDDLEIAKANIAEMRRMAEEEGNPGLEFLAFGSVVCGDSHADAQRYFDYYVHERGDTDATARLAETAGVNMRLWKDSQQMKQQITSGLGGYPIVGTPESIVEQLQHMSQVGYDGCVLVWVNYEEGLDQWEREVMPLVIESGLRRPARVSASS